MTNKDILIAAGVLAGVLLVAKLFHIGDSRNGSNYTDGVKNFIEDKSVPDYLKPPKSLFDGEPIVVTPRHEVVNFYGSKMN